MKALRNKLHLGGHGEFSTEERRPHPLGCGVQSPVLGDAPAGVSGCGKRPLPGPHPPPCARETGPSAEGRPEPPCVSVLPAHARPDWERSPEGASGPPRGVRRGRRAGSPRPVRRRPRWALPAPRRAPSPRPPADTPASAAPPPSSARLPFKRGAQSDLCRPRRGATPLYGGVRSGGSGGHDGRASGAGGRASGRRPPSAPPSRAEPRRGGGGGVGGPGRAGAGGGGRRGARPPALGSASDCGAAGRCVITMARSLCPGAWLRKPCYLQVGRGRAPRAPSVAARDLPASLLLPRVSAARTPLPPAVGTWRRALLAAARRSPRGSAARDPRRRPRAGRARRPRPPLPRPGLALAPRASREPRDVTDWGASLHP